MYVSHVGGKGLTTD